MAVICRFLAVICGSWWLSCTGCPIELFWTAKKGTQIPKKTSGFGNSAFLPVTGWKLGEKPRNAQNWKPHPNIWEFRSWLTAEWLTTLKQKKWPGFLWNPLSPSDWKKRPQKCYIALGSIFSLSSHEKLSYTWERQWQIQFQQHLATEGFFS